MSELFYPHGSGAELATYLYAKLLDEAGIRVAVITNRFQGEQEVTKSRNLVIFRLPLGDKNGSAKYGVIKRSDVLLSSFVRKLIKWCDIVYVPRFWFTAILLAKAHKKPVVTHLHDYVPICPLSVSYNSVEDALCSKRYGCSVRCIYLHECETRRLLGRLESVVLNSTLWPFLSKLIQCSDAVICVSRVQQSILIKQAPFLAGKTRVIYNPLPEAPPTPVESEDFGYFGGPNYLKGFGVLFEALSILDKKHLSNTIRIHATKFPLQCRTQTKRFSGIELIFYHRLDEASFEKVYRRISTVVVPSIWPEPLPYVVAEALMKGRLVIASNVGGINELVEGCSGTFLFEPKDHKHLCGLVKYVSDLDKRTILELGAKNRETFSKKFSNEKSLRDFIYLLERAVCR
jgi:glycosyltransferase involved in cell wall biosynthesis